MFLLSGISAYLAATWKRRYFWFSLAKLDLEMRYHESILGVAWSLLHPLAMTAILCFVFVSIFHVSLHSYVPFLLSGLAAWSFIAGVCAEGCNSIRQGEKFMRVYPAPVAIYALRTLCSQTFHFLVILASTVVLSWILLGFDNLRTLPLLLPVLLLLAAFGLSVILILGILDAYFPDNKHLVQVALQLVFYMLPIIYPAEALRNPTFKRILHYNPLAAMVALVREPIVDARVPALETWLIALGTTLALLIFAGWLVQRTERHIIFQL